jgi:hypothetical protein
VTLPFTGGMNCLCTETWQVLPLCAGETQPCYAYGLWVHPDCTRHVEHLAGMQETIKELRGDGLD